VDDRAIKIIKRGNIASLSRIDREVEAMVLLDHPTVVTCWEVLETESNICLVVEYCAGGHIGDYISPTRPMTESAARFYFTQLIDGLSYCHEHCVCHRDLRIENLMLDNKGDLKITDFGHAGIFQQGWDVFSTMMVGSVSHLAPEQVLGTVYSGEKIDMWSVGVILYLMVTGTAPFRGDTVEDLLDNIKLAKWEPIEDQGKQVSPDCLEIMEQTLRVDYKERPGCQQIKVMPFMKGSREKLVLAHCEFFISKPQANAAKFLDLIKGARWRVMCVCLSVCLSVSVCAPVCLCAS
jgi:serine/threonine protein kinase